MGNIVWLPKGRLLKRASTQHSLGNDPGRRFSFFFLSTWNCYSNDGAERLNFLTLENDRKKFERTEKGEEKKQDKGSSSILTFPYDPNLDRTTKHTCLRNKHAHHPMLAITPDIKTLLLICLANKTVATTFDNNTHRSCQKKKENKIKMLTKRPKTEKKKEGKSRSQNFVSGQGTPI